MPVIGLTGGIASGKSTAAARLRELGAVVLDADRIGHRVYEPGSPGFEKVVNQFGHDLVAPDGTIDRRVLGGKVFGDPARMKQLTDIVWPEIKRMAGQEIAELRRRDRNRVIVLEAAVLIEADWQDLADEVWVVMVPKEVAKARLMARNGLTADQAQARLDSQLSDQERAKHATVKLQNAGTEEEFLKRIDREWKRLQRRIEEAAVSPRRRR